MHLPTIDPIFFGTSHSTWRIIPVFYIPENERLDTQNDALEKVAPSTNLRRDESSQSKSTRSVMDSRLVLPFW